jgi:two-component system, NtrC family, sensor kinase
VFERATLLVVDDSRASARFIARAMGERGYATVVAHSGEEALAALASTRIDCVLLDMIMPGMSGEDTCRAIRNDPALRSVSVIIVTGRDGDHTTATIDAGADDYVVKSSDLRPLGARVHAQLRRRALERENARIASLELESRRKTAFLAMIAHELRTPLNAVFGFSSLLAEESLTETQRLYVENIVGGATDLHRVVERLVEFSELDRGTLVLQRQPIDVPSIVHTVERALSPLAAARGRRVDVEIDAGTPALIVDRARIVEVLIGLGSNAIKFSEDDVTLRARSCAMGVAFAIEDRGAGIAKEDVARILSGFDQLDGSVLNKKPGLGLGVAASKRLIELHGGTLDIQSARGAGTIVTVTLPTAA